MKFLKKVNFVLRLMALMDNGSGMCSGVFNRAEVMIGR